ncbi:MAG: polyprenyl synthetase family protein [Rhodocyclaceae bacterium]|nr:polyprenyl synthetase family protein [Rhodocyclaceae bacterium]
MSGTCGFSAWASAQRARIEEALASLLPPAHAEPCRLHEAMRYVVLGGGKRLRPLLVAATGEALGADLAQLTLIGCAVELMHLYSLVHDDLPAMDDDVLRHGRPTCHVEYDEATAILVGDALQALAFETLAHSTYPTAERRLAMLQLLAHAAGSRGLVGGQALDLAFEGKTISLPELEFMHLAKTGALVRASILLGAHAGEADEATMAALSTYATRLGLLYQVIDDLLDAEGTTATLGKTAGKDAAQAKATYVRMLGITRAREMAQELHTAAHAALTSCKLPTQRLQELADYIAHRQF